MTQVSHRHLCCVLYFTTVYSPVYSTLLCTSPVYCEAPIKAVVVLLLPFLLYHCLSCAHCHPTGYGISPLPRYQRARVQHPLCLHLPLLAVCANPGGRPSQR